MRRFMDAKDDSRPGDMEPWAEGLGGGTGGADGDVDTLSFRSSSAWAARLSLSASRLAMKLLAFACRLVPNSDSSL